MDFKTEAIFIGANRQTQVSDCHPESKLVAFGAGNTIALWNPADLNTVGVYQTLKGHKSEVTCVKFVPKSQYLVSASEDFKILIWKANNSGSYDCIQTIDHYTSTIVTLAVCTSIIAVGCADGKISLWSLKEDNFELAHEVPQQKNFLPLSLSLSNIKDSKYLLAVGGTSVDVFIYSFILNGCEISDCKISATMKGHEDWVKSLAFRHQETPGDYLLASGSQDRYIRLWRIRINDLIDDSDEDDTKLSLLSNKQYKFDVGSDLKVAIIFEALIMGHDDWISSLSWHESRLELLASTADTSVMIWVPDETSGIWICGSRLGEVSTKGASTATGSTGGFWSCLWFIQNSKDYILTNGKTGSWRLWESTDHTFWSHKLAITGSIKEVTDIAWSKSGDYLFSTSLDQTTRLFARCRRNSDGSAKVVESWHEFSRPQIHGYDMICIEPISETRFVSGGDEKILRSFDLPRDVSSILSKFSGISIENTSELPQSASIPALGLSNKAATDEIEEEEESAGNSDSNALTNDGQLDLASSLSTPPLEDQLQRLLLWPEIEKLYGHGYEITCVGVSPDQKLIASACRSNTAQHAVIRIFSTDSWLEIKPILAFHNLTITKLQFSDDSKYLLSVCRDRQWAVWERNFENDTFTLKFKNEKAHSRIIWDGCWVPQSFANAFITASRDKSIKFWNFEEENFKSLASVQFEVPVTAVCVSEAIIDGGILVAAGLENGSIFIYHYSNGVFKQVLEADEKITPAEKVTRLRWSNAKNADKSTLACSSSDTSVRIYSLKI